MTREIELSERDNQLPKKDKNLTEKQLIFAEKIAEGFNGTDAATLAGYADPGQEAWRLKQLPAVQNAIAAKVQTKFLTELLPCAARAIGEMIDDKSVPAPTRFKASEFVVNKSLEIIKANTVSDLAKIDPNNLSIQELELMVIKGKAIINQSVQQPVDNSPDTSQAIDLIEETS